MNYSVKLADTAKQDLWDIAIRIAQKAKDIEVAKKFVRELREECKELASLPDRGAFPKDRILRSSGYRYIVYKEYLILYLIDNERHIVNIMSIFNAKKDYFRVMRKYI